jgi:D-sedoheptulose 7-phosphate isomerase
MLLRENIQHTRDLLDACDQLAQPLGQAACVVHEALVKGRKILCCGNGGSAADAAHFAAEITGRYKIDRTGFPAIDLTGSPALVTALINDYPAEQLFARQLLALGQADDVLVVFTTSGNSANIQLALKQAKAMGIKAISFLGRDGGVCKSLAEVDLIVPGNVTARIQEVHQLLYHTLCEAIDGELAQLAGQRAEMVKG